MLIINPCLTFEIWRIQVVHEAEGIQGSRRLASVGPIGRRTDHGDHRSGAPRRRSHRDKNAGGEEGEGPVPETQQLTLEA